MNARSAGKAVWNHPIPFERRVHDGRWASASAFLTRNTGVAINLYLEKTDFFAKPIGESKRAEEMAPRPIHKEAQHQNNCNEPNSASQLKRAA